METPGDTVIIYVIGKTQNKHMIIVCQNLIGSVNRLQYKASLLFFGF